jgi:hypothetical protein
MATTTSPIPKRMPTILPMCLSIGR